LHCSVIAATTSGTRSTKSSPSTRTCEAQWLDDTGSRLGDPPHAAPCGYLPRTIRQRGIEPQRCELAGGFPILQPP
ncbi:MAG: hypothetical protein KBE42_12770, partial [Steroidobacteraceae bacterium]|nr:hypothetical protein [Steroidobacteraceae bacterium]